jgi:hypothetical protein
LLLVADDLVVAVAMVLTPLAWTRLTHPVRCRSNGQALAMLTGSAPSGCTGRGTTLILRRSKVKLCGAGGQTCRSKSRYQGRNGLRWHDRSGRLWLVCGTDSVSIPPDVAHCRAMMTPTECRARAYIASEAALSSPDPTTRAQWAETATGWLKLAGIGDTQIVLEEKLLGGETR